MKYYTLGIIFFLFSLITILMSYYYSDLTRSVEKETKSTQLQINSLHDKIKINKLEYAAHLHPEYLKKLEQIYFFDKYNKETDLKVVGIQEFSFKDLRQVIKVTSN
ncbi:MAG: hypothetical protein CFH23_00584 [Alphaproteobacteria bacterium MarineAlpha6_Bin1]|nr:MAG: hypothetical protein CFH23_00584 [Alphaproteobacteria bacterium MarineAlpha6_Bin1]